MDDIRIGPTLTIPAAELVVRFSRARGPGGQNVNKVESRVELRWAPGTSAALAPGDRRWLVSRLAPQLTATGDLVVTSERYRTQARNRSDAAEKLAALVRAALVRPKARRATRPTRGSVRRRLEAKRKRGEVKRSRRGVNSDQ
ncbi:MAG: alternative ribosome rescue aminoacyl-tRNA hydrolase ArfB [Myxococcales bacterium]|nr:alternative ribosome rescue aminoacyl-tRNA hydrolase ArfB [Myxococcales bacterium]MDD9971995.1 alternative ribosome rescue aminoacyl-tRNA hydrolase ArfB [Myxococcales bacterium]